jgi:hypothetical protein
MRCLSSHALCTMHGVQYGELVFAVMVVRYKYSPRTTPHTNQYTMRLAIISAFFAFVVVVVALPADKTPPNYACSQEEDCCPRPGPACA